MFSFTPRAWSLGGEFLSFFCFCGGAARSPCTPGGLGDYLSWLLVEGCTGCARQYGFKRVARSKRFHREGAYSPPANELSSLRRAPACRHDAQRSDGAGSQIWTPHLAPSRIASALTSAAPHKNHSSIHQVWGSALLYESISAARLVVMSDDRAAAPRGRARSEAKKIKT